ncbi:MAG: class I SAM-dependent RNA methyltransferase [Proteobacteria bacterium]|nr:class I SAM-dependent RNA methyltransferase [Candidatus Enterousia scatequi]
MTKCPFFGRCGGCKYDFAADDYHTKKLTEISEFSFTGAPHWCDQGVRWRADFCFGDGKFGFFARQSKDIVAVNTCPLMLPEINAVIPLLADLKWTGSGSCLVTSCANGLDVCIRSDVEYCSPEFKQGAQKIPAIRISWNGQTIKQTTVPTIKLGDRLVDYPSGAFLQPIPSEISGLRDMVVSHAAGSRKVADLFCGLGNFTFVLNADGFDIVGTGIKRDLFKKPLTPGMLSKYDCVVMDPPRAGALAQCQELVKSDIKKVIYVSCNPRTFVRDRDVLIHGGYNLSVLIPVDQFVGSAHWELFSVFEK